MAGEELLRIPGFAHQGRVRTLLTSGEEGVHVHHDPEAGEVPGRLEGKDLHVLIA